MENSVDSYINAQPEEAMSFGQFYKENNGVWATDNPDNFMVKFIDSLSGKRGEMESQYNAYLQNLNARNEFLAQQSARAYDKMMDDSKTQRAVKDYKAAGLNPYLLLNNGSLSSGTAPTSAKADYKYSREQKSKSTAGRDIALLILGVARLAAALL